jgi:hypothetical protein
MSKKVTGAVFALIAISTILLSACSPAAAPLSAASAIQDVSQAVQPVAAEEAAQVAAPAPIADNSAGAAFISSGNEAVNGRGNGGGGPTGYGEAYGLPPANPAGLSSAEAEGLIFMREEEKLARDVYTALYAIWGLPIFQSIATSEQTHMDSIKALLDRYGLPDPASSQAGVFTNPDLQKLYDELVALGSKSLTDGLLVGGKIEEIDILDLQTRLAQTSSADVQQVYNSLLRGSVNHLRAFSNNLQNQTGTVYQPQVMTQEVYQQLLGSASGGYGQGGRGGGRGQAGGGGRP